MPKKRIPPPFLYQMLTDDTPYARYFRKNIMKFNNALCLSKANMKRKKLKGGFQKFILSGRIAQCTPVMQRPEDSTSTPLDKRSAMIYTYDPEEQIGHRLNLNFLKKIKNHIQARGLLQQLAAMLEEENCHVQVLKAVWQENYEDAKSFQITLHGNIKPGLDQHEKVYALPTTDKPSILIPLDDIETDQIVHHEIVFTNKKTKVSTKINEENYLFDPLIWVLFHPYGELGYSGKMRNYDPKVTARKWYRYELFERKNVWNA